MKAIIATVTITLLLSSAFAEEGNHKPSAKEKSRNSTSSLVLNNEKKMAS